MMRTMTFGIRIIALARRIKETAITRSLISQLVRAGTSVGANYAEADDAVSRKDFIHKIALCRKESKETKHWLRMVAAINSEHDEDVDSLLKEAQELNLIFSTIVNRARKNIGQLGVGN